MRSPKKVYGYDTGMINAIKFKTGRDIGRLMENLVGVELMRRGGEFYYFRSVNGKEVDFVIKRGPKVDEFIQVCYDVNHHATRKRELAALAKAGKDFGCGHFTILTWDYEAEEKYSGKRVKFLPLWKWLIGM